MYTGPLLVDWRGLKKLGWPLSRTHTWRLMNDPEYAHVGFPKARKLGTFRNSHPVWWVPDLFKYFRSHGLPVPEDWDAP